MPEVTILPDGIRATADQDETLLEPLAGQGCGTGSVAGVVDAGSARSGCCSARFAMSAPSLPACSQMTSGWKASASAAGQCRSPTSSSNFRKETVCEGFWDLLTRMGLRFDHGRSADRRDGCQQ